jgi:hypothetical protein
MIAALALTAVLLPAAIVYVGAYARVARNEYQRQQLAQTVRAFEKANSRLRVEADAARARLRPAEVAQAYDLTVANPCTQVDYVRVPQAPGAQTGPGAPGNARWAAVASRVAALVTFEARAQASSLQMGGRPRAGR